MNLKSVIECERNSLMKIRPFLLRHKYKKIGVYLVLLCFIGLLVNKFSFDSLDVRFFAKSGVLVGMLIIAIAKEKIEDEFVSSLRLQSFALAFILGVIFSLFQPYLNYLVDYFIRPDQVIFEDSGDFHILWLLLSVKVFYFEMLKRAHQ